MERTTSVPILEVTQLVKTYGKMHALDGVSFCVMPGEIFGLLGPNGAGKTTALSIISALLEPTSGAVKISGRTLTRTDLELRREIGLVPQELAVYGELTALENLHFVGRLYGMHAAALNRRAEEVLQLVGLMERSNQRVSTYSGGMQRRLNLGMALMHRPKLLLLDEPTAGVDPQSRNHIFEGVKQLNREGTTIIYTSHYMEEVQTLCSRIGIIDHGKLIACDTLSDLLNLLQGFVRFRVHKITPQLRQRIEMLPFVTSHLRDEHTVEIECHDVKRTLVQLVGILNDLDLELVSLETEEPNLERVFLHLTGRALRD